MALVQEEPTEAAVRCHSPAKGLAFQAIRWVVSVSEDIEKVSEPTMLSCAPPPNNAACVRFPMSVNCHLKLARAAVRVSCSCWSCAVVRVRSHLEFVLGLVEAKAFGHQVQAVHHRLLCAEAPSQKQLL